MQDATTRHSSSYRDPSGFIFYHNGILYRQVNKVFKEDFDQFISGGLYDDLVARNFLVRHEVIEEDLTGIDDWYKTLQPEVLPFISYPYEWCFEMWKDAALITLDIAREAISHGMILKDASAYNVQWQKGKMIFIDTLSFEKYDEEEPWIAYRQFCEHFLAPLALMHYLKEPLQSLFIAYPDGIPLQMARKLLPFRSKLNLNVYLHIHLHGSVAQKPAQRNTAKKFSRQKLQNLLRSLKEAVMSFSLDQPSGVWSGYYKEATARQDYLLQKKQMVDEWSRKTGFETAVDLGANEGEFSELIASNAKLIISTDFDHYSVNQLYRNTSHTNVLPLVADLSRPSPAMGVNNEERLALTDRVKVDLVLALALIHHLAIGRNIPFEKIARLFQKAGTFLIIEFVPKEDEKIKLMLEGRKDVYQWYAKDQFINIFSKYYSILESKEIGTSNRTLYLMQAL
ncbi:MAG: class I SAM-dependent methyltransferase [Flavisolibacter sp.]